jgi:hypothetical protein
VGCFVCSWPSAAVPPGSISRASSLLPFPAPPSLTDGVHLSALSFPKSPCSARPGANAGQIADDGPATHHHPSVAWMPTCAPIALSHGIGYGALWCPIIAARLRLLLAALSPVKFQPRPTPRCSIQASVSCRCIPLSAASPANSWQAALSSRCRVALLRRSTAVKAATPPRCRCQAPGRQGLAQRLYFLLPC